MKKYGAKNCDISKIRISSCKIDAKKIVNENMGRCIGSSVLIVLPRFILLVFLIVIYIALEPKYAVLACVAIFILFVPTNSFCIAAGELSLSRAVDDFYILRSDDDGRKSVFKTLCEIGLLKLIKLRFLISVRVLSDTLFSAAPVAAITCFVVMFIRSSSMPTAAFFVSISGLAVIVFLAFSKISLERDKYRFIYCDESLFEADGLGGIDYTLQKSERDVLKSSCEICSKRAEAILKCESNFIKWSLFNTLYLNAYKRVTMGVIRTLPGFLPDYSDEKTQEIKANYDTVVFKIS